MAARDPSRPQVLPRPFFSHGFLSRLAQRTKRKRDYSKFSQSAPSWKQNNQQLCVSQKQLEFQNVLCHRKQYVASLYPYQDHNLRRCSWLWQHEDNIMSTVLIQSWKISGKADENVVRIPKEAEDLVEPNNAPKKIIAVLCHSRVKQNENRNRLFCSFK